MRGETRAGEGSAAIEFTPLVVLLRSTKLIGTLRSNDATATRTSLIKVNLSSYSLYLIVIIPTHLLCQMLANPPEGDFQVTIFKLRKRNKISSLLAYVLHKTRI